MDIAITSLDINDNSMPGLPWVTPSHIAGTAPAICAVAPNLFAAALIILGKCSSGLWAESISL